MLNLEQCTVSESVKRMLDTMFVQKRVPQALIIEGDHARTTELARVLASGLVCQAQDNKPCGHRVHLRLRRYEQFAAMRIYNPRKADVKYICCSVQKACLRRHKTLC